jgi:hypothetical protein
MQNHGHTNRWLTPHDKRSIVWIQAQWLHSLPKESSRHSNSINPEMHICLHSELVHHGMRIMQTTKRLQVAIPTSAYFPLKGVVCPTTENIRLKVIRPAKTA